MTHVSDSGRLVYQSTAARPTSPWQAVRHHCRRTYKEREYARNALNFGHLLQMTRPKTCKTITMRRKHEHGYEEQGGKRSNAVQAIEDL